MSSPSPSICLSQFEVRSSIDFITIRTPGKRVLPPLSGRPEWGVAAHYQQLTVHDLQPTDVPRLVRTFPDAAILGMEVTIDFVPTDTKGIEDRRTRLDACFHHVARHLFPYSAPAMGNAKTLAYVPHLKKTMPFNYRIPAPVEQLLYGLRDDGPVQVKVYRKGRDNGTELPGSSHSVRVEVRLKEAMCGALGLHTLTDLVGFSFRRVFSSYFRMAKRPVAEKHRLTRPLSKIVHDRIARGRQEEADKAWRATGVQGSRLVAGIRYRRDPVWNQRVGKALQRLQDQFGRKELVRTELMAALQPRELEHLTRACLAVPITIKYKSLLSSLLSTSKGGASITLNP